MADSNELWWSKDTIAVVTGSNKGLGFAIARGLARKGVTTILTARDELRGREAVELLKQEKGIDSSILYFHRLDVTSSSSVQEFAEWIKNKFGGLDILVNNAGISGSHYPGGDVQNSKAVIDTNFYGVRTVTESLISMMRPSLHGARIINVSSAVSRLDAFRNRDLADRISNVDKLSVETIDAFVKEFLSDVEKGKVEEKGWSGFFGVYDYCFSKVVLNTYMRMLARDLSKLTEDNKVFINCMCPGFTSTDMSKNHGHSADAGADTVIWLAFLPVSLCSSGRFYSNRTDVGFEKIPFYVENVVNALELDDFNECMRKIAASQTAASS